MKEKKTIICNNCGAKMDKDLERCPHCEAMNYFGAEKKYMEGLEDIREDLQELKDEAEEKRSRTMKILFVVGAVALFVVIVAYVVGSLKKDRSADMLEREYEETYIQRLGWEDKYFPLLDAAYEAGDYDKVAKIHEEHSEESGAKAYYSWSNYEFMNFYDKYLSVQRFEEDAYASLYWLSYAVELAGYWTQEKLEARAAQNWTKLTERDLKEIRGFQEYAWEVLKKYDLTEEEVYDIVEKSVRNDCFLASDCEKLLKEVLGESFEDDRAKGE